MNILKIPSEQPPAGTESRLKEWLARLVVGINASLESVRLYLVGIDDQIEVINNDIDVIEAALPIMVSDTATRLTAIAPAIDVAEQGWRDIVASIVVKGSGGKNPSWSVFRQGISSYEFIGTGAKLKEFWSVFHIDHDYKVGSAVYPHVHFAVGNSVATGNVKWFMEYTIAKGHKQSAFGATTVVSQVISIDGTPYRHYICEFAAGITSVELEPDAILLFRFYRSPADLQDTFQASIWAFASGLHYKFDRYGTRHKSPDFYL
jgi:hypothetical protein